MENITKQSRIIPVGTKRPDVKIWLEIISDRETNLYVALALQSMGKQEAKDRAEEIKNQEMLGLRHLFYQLQSPETGLVREIDGIKFSVTCYKFKKVAER
jgi:hypothetical protein